MEWGNKSLVFTPFNIRNRFRTIVTYRFMINFLFLH